VLEGWVVQRWEVRPDGTASVENMSERLRYGAVFDGIADAYDARRSGYPADIVAAAVELAGLAEGSDVVEVGAGTGKLTEELVAHGLRVDAVDPGANMLELARQRVGGSELVRFHLGRFEDVELPVESYDAVFAASSFHWVDPRLGWAKAASLLRPGGTIALVQPVGVRGPESGPILDELYAVFQHVAPEIAAERSQPRDEETLRAGFEEHSGNVSEAWAWLAHPGLGVPEAATLFGPATLTAVPRVVEHSADDLWATFETTAVYHRLTPAARDELRAADAEIIGRHGGILRSTQLVVLVAAPRRA
jgi:ubiquinone/menaquinone biosynthesis C-methylase UbiE